MNWTILTLVAFFMSLTANGFLIWIFIRELNLDAPLVEELKNQRDILRNENDALYEKIELMAASVPHIRLVSQDEVEIETVSNLEILDEDDVRIGNKGADVV
jgi:hypothetical protein